MAAPANPCTFGTCRAVVAIAFSFSCCKPVMLLFSVPRLHLCLLLLLLLPSYRFFPPGTPFGRTATFIDCTCPDLQPIPETQPSPHFQGRMMVGNDRHSLAVVNHGHERKLSKLTPLALSSWLLGWCCHCSELFSSARPSPLGYARGHEAASDAAPGSPGCQPLPALLRQAELLAGRPCLAVEV